MQTVIFSNEYTLISKDDKKQCLVIDQVFTKFY